MRYAFLFTVIALLELFSLGAMLCLQWWFQPWLTSTSSIAVGLSVFAITNGLLLLTMTKHFTNSYRWISGWMLVMHFMLLSALLVSLLYGGYQLLIMLGGSALLETNSVGIERRAIYLRVLAVITFIGLFIHALYSAYVPVVRKQIIRIHKPMTDDLRIAVASDLHLGALFGNKAIARLRRLVLDNQADILLMPGDIMDDNTKAFSAYNMQKEVSKLCTSLPYGAYATLGNHDLYGHEQPITESLKSAGVHLLNDEVKRLWHKGAPFWLVGRFDNHKRQRVATSELLAHVDTSEPVILLDHRPSDIVAHSQMPIDLQVSGHTHNGQIFPANFIISAINRLGYGYENINDRHFVVSSGYGFWGIPFRLGSRSEVWLITLKSH